MEALDAYCTIRDAVADAAHDEGLEIRTLGQLRQRGPAKGVGDVLEYGIELFKSENGDAELPNGVWACLQQRFITGKSYR